MDELLFVWHEAKAIANQNKHGVSFGEAATAFSDDFARLMPDPDHSEGEERFLLLGKSSRSRLLVVCLCEVAEGVIRIISARRANKSEQARYERFRHA